MAFYKLYVLLVLGITMSQLVPGAIAASSSQQDEIANMHSCSYWYDIDPKQIATKTNSAVLRARDRKTNEEVIIKVYKLFRHFEHEKTIFHALKARIFMSCVDKETAEINRGKFEASWRHLVRLLNKCRMKTEHSDRPALVIELLEERLSETIKLEKTPTSRKRRHESSLVATPQKQPSDNASPVSEFKAYAYQLLVAVDLLHKVSIFHLDVKPQNIGLTRDGTLKLFDFGLSSSSSIIRRYAGTLRFSAPEMDIGLAEEVFEKSNQADKMDIWSVGCTIYEIFTGYHMFYFKEFIDHVQVAVEKDPGPMLDCSKEAAYFYIKFTYFGSLTHKISSTDYKRAENGARERCPQIFSFNIIRFTQTETYTKSKEHRSDKQHYTEFKQKLRDLETNKLQKKMRFNPSSTEPGELVELLSDLLRFDFNKRITAHTALTQQLIFRNFPHQNKARDKFGLKIHKT